MEHIRTEIDIAAPASRVWAVLVDFARYPDWNPLIVRVRGWAEVGAPLDFRIALGGHRVPVTARVVGADHERELRWRGPRLRPLGLLFGGEHYFRIEPNERGCRVLHGEDFSGAVLPILWPRLRPLVAAGYAAMNAALKERVEAG